MATGTSKTRGRGTKNKPPPPPSAGEPEGGSRVAAGPNVDDQKIDGSVRAAYGRIEKLETQRRSLTADIAAERERLISLSLNRFAVELGKRYDRMSEDQRLGFDETLLIVRRAIGAPMQADLFGGTAAAMTALEQLIETDPDLAGVELDRLGKLLAARKAAMTDSGGTGAGAGDEAPSSAAPPH